jgi:glycosyltransferase involved in cell wall biosynthesis
MMLSLAERLQRDRNGVTVVVPRQGWVTESAERRGLEWRALGTGAGRFDWKLLSSLRALLRESRPHVIHCHMEGLCSYVLAASTGMGATRVLTLHGPGFMSVEGGRLARVHRWLAWRSLHAVVCVSDSLRERVLGLAPRGSEANVVVNWIEPSRPPADPSARTVLPDRKEGRVRAVAVGNYRSYKDYPTLFRAIAECRKAGVEIELLVAGSSQRPRDVDDTRRAIEGSGVSDLVQLLGFVPDVERVLGTADFYVSSSSVEGFSLTILQAMRAGRAVVATRSGGAEDLLEDGVTGLLVEAADPVLLAEAMVRIARSPELRDRLGRAARTRTEDWPDVARQAARYREIYERSRTSARVRAWE